MDGCWPLAPSFDTAGPMARDVSACVAMTSTLVPGFSAQECGLDELRAAIVWLDGADPAVRAQIEQAAVLFERRETLDFPLMPPNIDPAFQREVADVHRDLFADNAERYGSNVRRKVERALQVGDQEYEASVAARDRYRAEAAEAFAGFDILIVPTIGTVAPLRTVSEPDLRKPILRFTEPFNILGWPALALPCGVADDGLPASVTLAARWNEDDRVLGAGLALEAALERC
jgi:Asp-tRNA(Asn)/Glu-tRNA(Gln) amidotransferase A subunit family amidase